MVVFSVILYVVTMLLIIPFFLPDFWVNTNLPAALGLMLSFCMLSFIMLLRKRSKLFKRLSVYVLIFVVVFVLGQGVIVFFEAQTPEPERQPDCIIVVGSALYEQNKLTVELKGRLDEAILQLERTPDLPLILCGGVDENRSLPQSIAMKQYLEGQYGESGEKAPAMLLEETSINTYENLKFAYELMEKETGKKITSAYVVTNGYHFARVRMLASRVGFEAYPVRAALPLAKYPAYHAREFFALLKSMLLDGLFPAVAGFVENASGFGQ